MPIAVTCPNGHKLLVKDELGGNRVACPKCKAPFRIPLPEAPEEDAPVPQVLEDRPAAKPASRGGTCPSCGNALAPGSVLCINCGLDLRTGKNLQGTPTSPTAPHSSQARAPKRQRTKSRANLAAAKMPLLIGGGGAAAVGIVLAVFFFVLPRFSGPEATARAFMKASQNVDVEAVKGLLTEKAQQALGPQLSQPGMPAGGMPGVEMPEIDYSVGRATITGDTATIPITTEVSGPMGQQQMTSTLLMRREGGRWRIYGMSVSGGPAGMELTMDFENPQAAGEAMKRSLEAAVEEAKKKLPSGDDPTFSSPGAAGPQ